MSRRAVISAPFTGNDSPDGEGKRKRSSRKRTRSKHYARIKNGDHRLDNIYNMATVQDGSNDNLEAV